MSVCKTCGQPLNDGTVRSTDCGGDCLACMARFGDVDALVAIRADALKNAMDAEDRMAAIARRHGFKAPPRRIRRTLRSFWDGRRYLGLGPKALRRAWRVAGVPSPDQVLVDRRGRSEDTA
jgi:hypothetical protein